MDQTKEIGRASEIRIKYRVLVNSSIPMLVSFLTCILAMKVLTLGETE